MTAFEPLRNSVYSINSFLQGEYGDFGFVIEEMRLFPNGKYLGAMVRLEDDSRFLHVFEVTGQVAQGWENGVPIPCADETILFPGEERLAVFTKCGSGTVTIYPVKSQDVEKDALQVIFSKLPLYVNFTRNERLVVFSDYKVEYMAPEGVEIVKIPTPPNGYAFIHAVKDTDDALYILYTWREGNKQRIHFGRIPIPIFPYYSPMEFWDGVEVLSKFSMAPGGGKQIGDMIVQEDKFVAVLGTKGGREIYLLTPSKNWVLLLPGELVYVSLIDSGLFIITGVYRGNLNAGIVPYDVLESVEEIKESNLTGRIVLGRYVPGVVDPKFSGISRDGRVLYFGRTTGRTSRGGFYYYLRRDVDYLYVLNVETAPRAAPQAETSSPFPSNRDTRELGLLDETMEPGIEQLLRRFRQVVLYGPPGTGKTYMAMRIAENAEFVTFHQSYSYEDFIEGFRPVKKGGTMVYDVVDGVFKKLAIRAIYSSLPDGHRERNPSYETMKKAVIDFLEKKLNGKNVRLQPREEFYLIVDEINRGNISRILGELITLLDPDKRLNGPNEAIVTLPYSGEPFAVPPNLYIIGTMNSADRSIALVDVALRRRFAFVEVLPRPEKLGGIEVEGINLEHLLTRINSIIEIEKGKDYTIGHGYFLEVLQSENPKEALYMVFYYKILPLFQEYFYNDWERLRSLYPGFDFIDDRGRIIRMDIDEFISTLKRLVSVE
ncbi:restriction endonuclease [Thermococcus siculi]|uniref:Restriction endonuclease n=1 Tax=Thermococcus siculi TaxID=72803 RepID=A0A2Z2MN98_9EURY|nr:AAA family ATPase [Thermococcus siculi]ASJ09308.1 restriction endonuclease [Thermococcus siculi]